MPDNPLASGTFCPNCWTRLDDHTSSGTVILRDCPVCAPEPESAA